MRLEELQEQIRNILPDAQFEEDNDGQIVIYTNMEETPNGNLRFFEPPPDPERDFYESGGVAENGGSV